MMAFKGPNGGTTPLEIAGRSRWTRLRRRAKQAQCIGQVLLTIRSAGRFTHEGAVMDPATGYLYMTQDDFSAPPASTATCHPLATMQLYLVFEAPPTAPGDVGPVDNLPALRLLEPPLSNYALALRRPVG